MMRVTKSAPHSPLLAYPGHDPRASYRSPPDVPRVKREGESNYIKGRGSLKPWVFNFDGPYYNSPRPDPRCPTKESKANYQLGWHGTVAPILNGNATPRCVTAPPRVKPEGQGIATLGKGHRMKVTIHEYGEHGPTPRNPRVKPEAGETAEVHKGGRMKNLIHKHGLMPQSSRAVPRVKPEANAIALLSKGKRMNNLIHKFAKNDPSPRPIPRVKTEAEGIANLSRGKRMNRLVHSYGTMPLSSRPVPRVKPEAEAHATLDLGGRMSRLMHDTQNYPSSARPVPRVRTSEASKIARYSQGQMGRILKENGRRTFIHMPGTQSKTYSRPKTM